MKFIKSFFILSLLVCTTFSQSQTILSHNVSGELLPTGMYACTGGGLRWARSFNLLDFGISENEDFIITSADFGIYAVSSWDNYIKFNIYGIDQDFPDVFQLTSLIGSSQNVEVPYFGSSSPQIKTIIFDTPITVPAGTTSILVEVEQSGTVDAFHHVFAGLAVNDGNKSWMRSISGCAPSVYTDIAELEPNPSENSFYITASGTRATAKIKMFDNLIASIHPNPAKSLINVHTDADILKYEIINILGQSVNSGYLTSDQKFISVEGLENGVYYLRFNSGDNRHALKKIIKE